MIIGDAGLFANCIHIEFLSSVSRGSVLDVFIAIEYKKLQVKTIDGIHV